MKNIGFFLVPFSMVFFIFNTEVFGVRPFVRAVQRTGMFRVLPTSRSWSAPRKPFPMTTAWRQTTPFIPTAKNRSFHTSSPLMSGAQKDRFGARGKNEVERDRVARQMVLCMHAAVKNERTITLYFDHSSDSRFIGVDFPVGKDGETGLILAACNDCLELARMLIEAGADLDAQDTWGGTALSWAARKGRNEIAQMLIEAGANIDLQDYFGVTALSWAAQDGFTEIVQMLLDAGAKVDLKRQDGATALHWAVLERHNKIVQMLIEAGANLHLRWFGKTPLKVAESNDDTELTEMLASAVDDSNPDSTA